MYTTNNYQEAAQEARRTGKPVWRHADGTYAVACTSEFEDSEAWDWTEIEI